MTKASIVAALVVAMLADDLAAARSSCLFCAPPGPAAHRRQHPRHHRHRTPSRYDPTLCRDVIAAFDQLSVRDLDAYVSSIPEQKRREAARCLKGRAR